MSTSESQDQPTAAHIPADPSTVSGGESPGADTSTAGSLGNKLLGLAGLGEETTPTGRPTGGGGPAPSIPGYEILGELGRGGMGVVYMARQLDLNRTVALKVILAGGYASEAEVARFVGESEAVARVDHPNVVRVYHAGRHDRLPFFAMEFVDGGTLADRVKDGPLPARESAELLEQVARGVAAVHGTGIIHRDLKPGNVLVTRDGTPKVTDFGLAKRVNTGDGLTASGAVMGTPSYMAPEQARGEAKGVGPAADVYALGAVLYCLLTGRPPFQGPSTVDTLLQVMTADPVPLRQLQPGTPRDLETIVLKCLEKDPAKRYGSAEALADDLARFLDGKPVLARPAGPVERGWKWVQRNRVPAGVAAGVIVALTAAAAVTSAQAVEAERARAAAVQEATNARIAEGNAREAERLAADRARTEQEARAEAVRRTAEAERQERAATAVKEFLQAVLVQASATVQATFTRTTNPNFTVKEAMDYASRQIDGRFPDHPLTEADLRETIGTVYGHLGSYPEAEAHLRRAVDLRTRAQGERDPATLAAVDHLAGMYQFTRQFAKAEELYSRTLRERQRALGEDHPSTLAGKSALAGVYWAWGKYAEAEPLIREVVTKGRRVKPPHPGVFVAMSNLAQLHASRRQYGEAEPLYVEAVEGLRGQSGDDHPDTLKAVSGLAGVYAALRKYDRAEELYQAALDGSRRTYGDVHPDVAAGLSNLAGLHRHLGRYDKAAPLLARAVDTWRKALGADNPNTLVNLANLGVVYREMGRDDRAEPLLVQALDGKRRVLGRGHPSTLATLDQLVGVYKRQGAADRAEPLLRELLELFERRKGQEAAVADIRSQLGGALLGQKKYSDAEPLLLAGFHGLRDRADDIPISDRNPTLREAADRLTRLYEATGQAAEARRWRAEAAKYPEIAPPPRPAQ